MRLAGLLLLALLVPGSAGAGADPAPPPATGLDSFFLLQGLARFGAQDPAGLGAEAREASAWAGGRAAIELRSSATGFELGDGVDAHRLSPDLANALRRLRDYLRLSTSARMAPVPTSAIREAALRAESVARVRDLFDRALAEAIVLDGEPVIPELGGDALLLGDVFEPRTFEDPTRSALLAVAERQDDPAALRALFAEKGEALSLLDANGQLEAEVGLFEQRAARGIPLERRRRPLDMAVETILRNGSDSFTLHPREQLECIIAQDWTEGRLLGLWHLHPPGWSEAGLVAAAAPSPDDRRIARANGQFLTLVFRPDGFDLHDLQASPLGPESSERSIEYRSEAWRDHFARAHAQVKTRLTTWPSR